MCQGLEFVYFFPVEDVTVLVQLQGREEDISSSTGLSSSRDSCRRRRATAGGTVFPTTEVSGGVFNSGGFSRRRALGEGRSS